MTTIIEAVNGARASRGLPPLTPNTQLEEAAQGHAEDLAANPYLIQTGQYHIGANGSTIEERIRATGYEPVQFSEITGWGFSGDPAAMVSWWTNSQAHASYLYANNVEEIGIGYVAAPGSPWGFYWVVDFGRPVAAPVKQPCPCCGRG